MMDGTISMDELEEFSDDVKTAVRMLLRMEKIMNWIRYYSERSIHR